MPTNILPFHSIKYFVLLSMGLLLAACGSSPRIENPTPLSELPVSATAAEYQIQPGDDLDIRFFYNPELNDQQRVRPDGRISLQLVGEQMVAGKTPHQVEAQLRQSYDRELKQPEVAVIVRGFGGQRVYVDGEVAKPGMMDLTGGVTALQAVAFSGGATTKADLDEVILIRRVGTHAVAVPLNLKAAIEGTDFSQDVVLKPSDIVYVPRSGIANVNLFVEQYFRNNVPVPFGLGYSL